jgi:metal-dependent amidase/aminoacylase/carboxypeptidase family protein
MASIWRGRDHRRWRKLWWRSLLAGASALSATSASAADLATEVKSALPVVHDAYVFLHTHPELGKQESQAHDFLKKRMAEIGYTRFVVISITKFVANGGARNVLPAEASALGTLRAFEDPKVAPPGGVSLEALLAGELDGLSKAYGLTYAWRLDPGSPPTVNDPQLFDAVIRPLSAAFPGRIDTAPHKGMSSEDFAYYTPHFQALYFSLGIAKDGLGAGNIHTADFTVHPDAFAYGLTLMGLLAEIGVTGHAHWTAARK